MTTIKTPYDEAVFGRYSQEAIRRQEGYRRGVADTEARYKPLLEASGAFYEAPRFHCPACNEGHSMSTKEAELWKMLSNALDGLKVTHHA